MKSVSVVKRVAMWLGITLFTLGALVGIYFGMEYILASWTVDKVAEADQSVVIYLRSNGVHTDVVLPVQHELRDWTTMLPPKYVNDTSCARQFVGIGWGDKGFYLDTPTWDDLTFKTAFVAAFGLGSSAMHITYYGDIKEDSLCKKLYISKRQYKDLMSYIDNAFLYDGAGKTIHIDRTGVNYGETDTFFEGSGKYSLFHTCNTWTNNALKAAGQTCCKWTAFQAGIMEKYQK